MFTINLCICYLINKRWETLLQKYPQAKDYLIRSLGCNFQSWARAFTSKYFTAGAQTTSRNEGENSVLKRLLLRKLKPFIMNYLTH